MAYGIGIEKLVFDRGWGVKGRSKKTSTGIYYGNEKRRYRDGRAVEDLSEKLRLEGEVEKWRGG